MVETQIEQGSPAGSITGYDWHKILKGALIAAGGAALAQLSVYLNTGVAFDWKVWLGAILAVGLNAAWKYFSDTTTTTVKNEVTLK
jgi:hypothetical protein